MPKNNFKAIIFDWGGVCCAEAEPFASLALQKKLGLNPDQIAAAVQDIYRGYYRGEYSKQSYWEAIIKHFNLSEDSEINPEALADAYLNSYQVYQPILDYALELKKTYQVALLSNLTPEMRDHIQTKHETNKYFSPEVYSCDSDVADLKPDPKPYLDILQKLNLKPEECLFIDNSPKNIAGANTLGIKTYLFITPEKFFEDIKNIL